MHIFYGEKEIGSMFFVFTWRDKGGWYPSVDGGKVRRKDRRLKVWTKKIDTITSLLQCVADGGVIVKLIVSTVCGERFDLISAMKERSYESPNERPGPLYCPICGLPQD